MLAAVHDNNCTSYKAVGHGTASTAMAVLVFSKFTALHMHYCNLSIVGVVAKYNRVPRMVKH